MTDSSAYEELMRLIDQVEMATSQPMCAYFTSRAWKWELKRHQDRFGRNDKGELLWLGSKVVVIGDDKSFWTLADKIIPKENQND